MDSILPIDRCTGFIWDAVNVQAASQKDAVSAAECEQIFFNRPLFVEAGSVQSDADSRHSVLGRTDTGRFLNVIFVLRSESIRVIAAHDMSGREREAFLR